MLPRWISGALAGTLIVAVTSPMFVRSYAPRQFNRGVWTLPAGTQYRWRSEGYATTFIGPHGMPGRTSLASSTENGRRVALWGDSQAEGVCVDDIDKIFAIAQRRSADRLVVFPLAQSGDDVHDWLRQITWSEEKLAVTQHVFLIVQLRDLAGNEETVADDPPPQWSQFSAAVLPAMLISAIRNAATTADGSPRRLRFRPGPIVPTSSLAESMLEADQFASIDSHLQRLRGTASGKITIVYAPQLPAIVAGTVYTDDPDDRLFQHLRTVAADLLINVVDLRPDLLESAGRGAWPHGFHNGRIGDGHLNATGNELVADAIIDVLMNVRR